MDVAARHVVLAEGQAKAKSARFPRPRQSSVRTIAKAFTAGRTLDAKKKGKGGKSDGLATKSEAESAPDCCFEELVYPYGVEPTYGLFKHLGRCMGRSRLQLWIPDTIVLGQGKPYWLYSSRSGYLQKTTRFDKSHILEKLGNRRYKDDYAVVVKRLKSRTQNTILSRLRNTTTVLTTTGLQALLASEDVYYDKLIIQRFIKCKGKKPAILRAHWQFKRPFKAWFITSQHRFDQPTGAKEDSSANLLFSLSENKGAVDVFGLHGKACMESSHQTMLLLEHIQSVLGQRLEELAVDYIRDTSGNLWFLQVKGYKLMHQASKTRLSPSSPGLVLEKKCRFCMRSLQKEQTCFRLTAQMILETSARLIKRLPRDTYESIFAAQAGGDLGADPSKLYHGHRVCELCYELFQKEKRLARTCAQFCRLLGNRVKLSVDLPESVTALTRQPLNRFGFCLQDEVFKQHISKDQKQHSSVQQMSLYRLFIALHEIHQLPDLASFLSSTDSMQKKKKKKQRMEVVLALEILGNLIQIDISQEIQRARSRSELSFVTINQCRLINFFTEEPQDEPLASHKSGVSMLIELQQEVTLKLIELCGEDSGEPASTKRPTLPSLLRKKHPDAKVIGQCHIPLVQFKSSLVRNSTMVLPLGFHNELCQMRVSLGIQRVHQTLHPNALGRTFQRGGIFQSIEPFHVSAPLPEEWIDALKSTPQTVARKIEQRQRRQEAEEMRSLRASRVEEDAHALRIEMAQTWCLQVEFHQLRNLHHQQLAKVTNLYVQYEVAGASFSSQVMPLDRSSSSLDFSYLHKHFLRGSKEMLQEFVQTMDKRLEIKLFTSMDPEETFTTQALSQIVKDADETGHHCMTRGELLSCFKHWETSPKADKIEPFEKAMMQQVFKNLQELWQREGQRSTLNESVILDELLHLCLILNRLHKLCHEHETGLQERLIRLAPETFFPSHRCSFEPELCALYEKQKDTFIKAISSPACEDALASIEVDDRWMVVLRALDDVQRLHSGDVHATDLCEPEHMLTILNSPNSSKHLVYKFTIFLAPFLQGQTSIDVTYQVTKVKEKKPKHEVLQGMVQGMNNTRKRLIWEYVFRSAEESADCGALISDLTYTLEELLTGAEDKRWFISEDECRIMLKTLEKIERQGQEKVTIPELLAAGDDKKATGPPSVLKQRFAALKWKAAVFPTYIATKLSLYPTTASDQSAVIPLHSNHD